MPRIQGKGLLFSSSGKENPINFSSMGIGARGTAIRNRVSKAVFGPNRGVNFVGGTITPGINTIISNIVGGFIVSENGTTQTFTVKLDRKPLNKTAVLIESGDLTEVTTDIKRIEFDRNTWNIPVTITVKGVDDNIVDSTINTYIKVSVLYGNNVRLIAIKNYDDDNVAVQQIVIANIFSTQIVKGEGSSVSIGFYLSNKPDIDMSITPTSSIKVGTYDLANITFTPAIRTFTPENYNVTQYVTVNIADDEVDDIAKRVLTVSFVNGIVTLGGLDIDLIDNDVIGINIGTVPTIMYQDIPETISTNLLKAPAMGVHVTTTQDPLNTIAVIPPLIFDTATYNTPQNIMLNGDTDTVFTAPIDLNLTFKFTTLEDADIPQYSYTDTAQIKVYSDYRHFLTSVSTIEVNEGELFTFDISLSTRPVGPLDVSITSGTGVTDVELIANITFNNDTDSAWQTNQPVTITPKVTGSGLTANTTLTISSLSDAFVNKVITLDVIHPVAVV